jgi:iron(III) transport system substrate-binding protein
VLPWSLIAALPIIRYDLRNCRKGKRGGHMRAWIALIALMLSCAAAQAQPFAPDPVDEAAARKEGQVTWYTSTPVAIGQQIANEFQKKYGIRVEMLRTGGQGVIRRFMQEASSGRILVDVMTMSDMSAANAMTRQGLFVPFRPEGFDQIIPDAKDAKGHYIAQRLTLVGMVARTDKVKAADLPKTWRDLTTPKYKGMMVMADPSFTAIQLMVVGTLSKRYGWGFYEALRKNDTLIVQGHEQIYDMVRRGERVLAAESSDPRIYNGGKMPPNMTAIFPQIGSMLVPSPTAVIKGSPRPNAAKLFAQYQVSREVQMKFVEEGRPSPRSDLPTPEGMPALSSIEFYPIDYDYIENNARQLKARFADIFQ